MDPNKPPDPPYLNPSSNTRKVVKRKAKNSPKFNQASRKLRSGNKFQVLRDTQAEEISLDSDSNLTGILSDSESGRESLQGTNTRRMMPQKALHQNSPENCSAANRNIQKLYMISEDSNTLFNKVNSIKLTRVINSISGNVEDIIFLRSGALLVTCKSSEQIQKFLNTNEIEFNDKVIPIKVVPAKIGNTQKGVIYAPELCNSSCEEIQEELTSYNVTLVEKLYRDPDKATVPLYIITFESKTLPEKIAIAYKPYKVDPYIPQPLRCTQCCRYGHTKKYCRSHVICNKCASKDHTSDTCQESVSKCINCGGVHSSFDKSCPKYLKEKKICEIKTRQNISFQEARAMVNNENSMPSQTQYQQKENYNPTLSSPQEFPALPQRWNAPIPTGNVPGATARGPSSHLSSQGYPAPSQAWNASIPAGMVPGATVRRPYPKPSWRPNTETNPIESTPYDYQNHRREDPPQSQTNFNSCSTSNNQSQPNNPTNLDSFPTMNYIIPLIPPLIRLLFAKTVSEKIMCLNEIAAQLNLQDLVKTVTDSLGISSAVHEDQ